MSPSDKWPLTNARLPCSCPRCREQYLLSIDACIYKKDRNMVKSFVKRITTGDNNNPIDPFGIRQVTCALLKVELRARHLVMMGLKPVLIARLEATLTSEIDGSTEAAPPTLLE